MKIITTPMCEDVLRISGLEDYSVVKPDEIGNADIAILLSETRSEIPKISIKLNTFKQLYDSIIQISDEFSTTADDNELKAIRKLINENNEKKDKRQNTKVKVYSNFLKDIILDMGFTINESDYEYIVIPDYLNIECDVDKEVVIIPSHKNVSKNIINRIRERYELLERKLCMKQ